MATLIRMARIASKLSGALATFAVLFSTAAAADGDPTPSAIQQQQPSFYVHVDVDKITRAYHTGDSLRVKVECEIDAYVYVLYQQADGKLFQIFPNSSQKDNHVTAKKAVQIPAAGDVFRWQVGPPLGKEMIKVLATREPLVGLSAVELASKRFNPVSTKTLAAVEKELGAGAPAVWAEDQLEITTYGSDQALASGEKRRFGVFFGLSKYRYNEAAKEITDGKWTLDRPYNASSASVMRTLSKEVGQFNETRLYLNEEATRGQIEESITQWLPSVSRPGDTVLIYYCGHGGQIDDDNGDEADGKDEYLLPYDFADSGIFEGLVKLREAGRLPEPMLESFQAMNAIVNRLEGNRAKVDQVLVRGSGISDDLFGHWLQKLSGRQVLVIFEACHSGGFANQEKDLQGGSQNPDAGFDYLDGELGRLKDIGQPDSALLVACAAAQTSYAVRVTDRELDGVKASLPAGAERVKDGMCVMTYCLADAMIRAPGSLEMKDAHRACQSGMQDYFIRVAAKWPKGTPLKPHEAHLFDFCTKPAYLKP